MKYHQDKPRPDIKAEVFESLQKVAVPRHEPSSSPVPRTAKPVPVEKETRSTATSKNAPPAKQSPFTDTDSKALLDIYDDIINLDETKADDAWEAWADNVSMHPEPGKILDCLANPFSRIPNIRPSSGKDFGRM